MELGKAFGMTRYTCRRANALAALAVVAASCGDVQRQDRAAAENRQGLERERLVGGRHVEVVPRPHGQGTTMMSPAWTWMPSSTRMFDPTGRR